MRNLINSNQEQKLVLKVTLILSSNVIGNSNEDTKFHYKLLLTNLQVLRLHKAFLNNLSPYIKSSKT